MLLKIENLFDVFVISPFLMAPGHFYVVPNTVVLLQYVSVPFTQFRGFRNFD